MKNTEIIMNDEWYANYIAVQKSLADDREWEKLYGLSYRKVYNYVSRIFRARYMHGFTIEDVVAESFERCYFDRERFNGTCKFTTWVCAYARYVMLSMMSRSACYQRRISERCSEEIADKLNGSPLWHIEKSERDRFIWMAYDSLSFEHQKMLDCYVLNEITPTEAEILTGLCRHRRKEELEIAVDVLRRRFLSLFGDDDYGYMN